MQCFKVGEKKNYYVEFDRSECIITEFGDKENEYVFTLDELKDLEIKLNNFNVFSKNKVFMNAATDVCVSGLNEDGVCIKIQTSIQQAPSFIQVPLADFCKDLIEIYSAKSKDVVIDAQMPSVKAAYEKWKKRSTFLFLDGQFLLLDALNQTVGAGYFDGERLKVLEKSNLSLFESLKLYYPLGNYVTVSLQLIEKGRKTLSTYSINSVETNDIKSPEKLTADLKKKLDALLTLDLSDPSEFELAYSATNIQEIGRAKSTLDNFLSL